MAERKARGHAAVRAGVFICLCILLLMLCSNILKEKWHKYDTLYELRDHSVDYLALGMSQMFYGINPIYIYDHTGYLGFNLCNEAQHI